MYLLEAGGKPSTWFPPGGLVEPPPTPIFKIPYENENFEKIEIFKKNLGNRENH